MQPPTDSKRTRSRSRAFLRELSLFSLFVALAIFFTWPLAIQMETAVSDPGDPLLNTWILDWVLHSLTHDPFNLFNAPMFAGARLPLAFSENLVGTAILVLPFKLAGLTPIAVYNVALLLGFALSGYGMTVLARTTGASIPASIVAAISFGFCQFFFDHLAHLQVVSAGWLPLMLAALIHLLRRRSWGSVILFAAAFAMNGLTNVYWLLYGGVTAAATIGLFFAVDGSLRNRVAIARIASGFALAAVVLLPFLIPYRIVSEEYGLVRRWQDISAGSATPLDYFRATPASAVHGSAPLAYVPERQLATGLLPLFLAAAAILLARRRDTGLVAEPISASPRLLRFLDVTAALLAILGYFASVSAQPLEITSSDEVVLQLERGSAVLFLALLVVLTRWWLRLPTLFGSGEPKSLKGVIARSRFWPVEVAALLWIALAFLGSLGQNSFVYGFFYAFFEPFRAMRVPARWAVIVYVGLALLASHGADLLAAHRRGWRRPALFGALAILALIDVRPRILWHQVVTDRVPVYDWLKSGQVRGPIFELPMAGEGIPYSYLLGSTHHRVPLVNGTSGFSPPWDEQLHRLSERNEFNDAFLTLLLAQGTKLLVVHADLLGAQSEPVLTWVAKEIRDGRLMLVDRFDRGTKGDYVFALHDAEYRNPSQARPARRDAAGFTAEENWQRMLRGEPVYSSIPLLHLATPAAGEEMHRRLVISGWTVAPKGIRSIEVLIHGGRLRYVPDRVASPDVSAAYPWYRNDPSPAFTLTIPKRPKGIPKRTDVQVRVTDREGRQIHSDDRFIYWH